MHLICNTILFLSISLHLIAAGASHQKGPTTTKPTCPYPELVNGTVQLGDNIVDLHRHAVDVLFKGQLMRKKLNKQCKIRCINGEWVGPVCQTIEGDNKFHPVYKSCTTENFQKNFIVVYKNKVQWEPQEFEDGDRIQVRCRNFGLYKLIGDSRVKCHNGQWKPRVPTCISTSFLHNFTDDSSPPTVLARLTSGSMSVEPSGELAVYPGSVLHLECLHARTQGEPEWSWTSTYRTYPTGWSISPGDRGWKYRLSIYYIKPQDTGIYTCATPKGVTHSVVVNVVSVTCNAALISQQQNPHLLTHVEGTRLGQLIQFSCGEGFQLIGMKNATCQASGVWSSDAPHCEPIACPAWQVPEDSTVRILRQEVQYGGRAIFECPKGHQLLGAAVLLCDKDGQWTGPLPECKEILCSPPMIPQNGHMEIENETSTSIFPVGSVVSFSCDDGHQLVGERSIVCADAGFWSNPPPFCRLKCNSPGIVENGEYIPRKEVYSVGERVTLTCEEGFNPSSRTRPRCLRNGQWSDLDIQCKANRQRSHPTTTISTPIFL